MQIFSFFEQERIVVENTSWLCVVPYWAVWPYETMVLPKRHVLRLEDLTDRERNGINAGYYDLMTNCNYSVD